MINFLTKAIPRSFAAGAILSPLYRSNKYSFSTEKPTEPIFVEQFPANEPIQDRVNVMKLSNPSGYYFGVFDGHGGDFVSNYVNNNLPDVLAEQLRTNSASANNKQSIHKSINEAFQLVEKAVYEEMRKAADIRLITTGSCALVSLLLNKTLYVANAGDCQGILIKQDGSITKLNNRHNIAQHPQQQRLKKLFPGENDLAVYPPNGGCYLKGRLQPTYSFGDFYLKFKQLNITRIKNFTGPYVQYRPQIKEFQIAEDDKYLLLATDGLWDEYDHKGVSEILLRGEGSNPGRYLITTVLNKVSDRLGVPFEKLLSVKNRRNYHDDITFIVVDLEKLKSE